MPHPPPDRPDAPAPATLRGALSVIAVFVAGLVLLGTVVIVLAFLFL